DDLELLFVALEQMFEHDHSAARGEMGTCKLFVFEHESALGNAPARKLFDLVDVRSVDPSRASRKFSDYQVTVNRDDLPLDVTLHERV
ncbi:MAG: type I CRISPR-associated protein Cas7, partial [Deltaproteobacteria bacterium]